MADRANQKQPFLDERYLESTSRILSAIDPRGEAFFVMGIGGSLLIAVD
jgi:hypothetical protein